MFKRRSKIFEIEKDSGFATRVLMLSMPSALVFMALEYCNYGVCLDCVVQLGMAFPNYV